MTNQSPSCSRSVARKAASSSTSSSTSACSTSSTSACSTTSTSACSTTSTSACSTSSTSACSTTSTSACSTTSTSACSTTSTSACSTTSTSACSTTSTSAGTSTSGSLLAAWSAETSEVHCSDTLMTYFLTACGYVPDVALRDVTYRMGKRYLPKVREISLTNTWSKLHTRPMTTETKTITTEVYVTSSCRVGRTTLRSSSRI